MVNLVDYFVNPDDHMPKSRRRSWPDLRAEMLSSSARAFATVYRRFQSAANDAYAARGWKDASLTHVQFLAELDEAGTRLSDVAASLGTTKQYAGKLARELESRGLIALGDDPADRRAVLARPTARGRAFFEDANDVREELEADLFAKLSPARATAFVGILEDLLGGR